MQKTIFASNKTVSKDSAVYEKCVLCGKQTDIKSDTHIDMRDFYVEGAGQLCRDCWLSVYGKGKEKLP